MLVCFAAPSCGYHPAFTKTNPKHPPTTTAPALLNPTAIGALHALGQRGDTVGRVAIIDIDAHHGDGTEEVVRAYPQVRQCVGLLGQFNSIVGGWGNLI